MGRRMHPGITAPPSRAQTITKPIRRRVSQGCACGIGCRAADQERPTFFEDEKGGIVRGIGMGVKKVAKKGVDTATGFAHQKVHQVEKRTIPAWRLLISRKKPPNACTTLSKAGKSRKRHPPERRKKRWGGSEVQPSEILRERGRHGRKCSRTAAEKETAPAATDCRRR